MQRLLTLQERLSNPRISELESAQRAVFEDFVKNSKLPANSIGLSVSVGDGIWDYLAFKSCKNIKKLFASDIIDCPVNYKDIALLQTLGVWEFHKVTKETVLPFASSFFDLVYHQDVIEHVENPVLFLSEQYRVMKKGGVLILGTPNLFRPANILKLMIGRLTFPVKLGTKEVIGDYIHVQEFYDQQLLLLLKEVGFVNIEIKYIYFGMYFLNLNFNTYPSSDFGKKMCHFIMCKCEK
ncbi:MAG: methyltransferase domain-containing protein [Nitrospirae bacterium]|nr:methyltransferase domain-containing protein [Nitrospirota bacterium]